MTVRIAIIDDEVKMGKVVQRALTREGWEARAFADPLEALARLENDPADIVLCDLKMPRLDGIEVLERAKRLNPATEFIIMTAYASAQTAVESMKKGAFDYLIKPFPMDELKMLVRRIIETRQLREENVRLRELVAEKFRVENLVAVSGPMREVLARVRKVAPTEATVLLRGESGSGKEVLANAIVQNSARQNRPFLKINCGALPETLLESELFGHVKGAFTGAHENRTGLFETADRGTLFLDEIGEISPALQVKLLRVLQDGEFQPVGDSRTRRVDVRVITATNRDLEEMLRDGTFRQDLYYRLNVVPILIPPLRERREGVPALIEHFLRRQQKKSAAAPKELSAAAYELLVNYDWPGNIRELENAIEHALVMSEGDRLEADDLPLALRARQAAAHGPSPAARHDLTLADLERQAIEFALQRANFNYTRAATFLGVTRRALGYRMRKHQISGKDGLPPDDLPDE